MKSEEQKSFTKWDFSIYVLLITFCYFSFQQSDILHTGGSSLTALNGHVLDFYEANKATFGGNNYLPSSYILFAIWNIPLKLFGIVEEPSMDVGYVVFWYKLLPTIFYFATAIIIYHIGLVMNFKKVKSILMSCVWISTPIAVFSQFIFGQYDIFTIFFTLLGLLFFLKKKHGFFILFFGIAITFKYFPLFIFIPLLLLTEKKVKNLIIKVLLFLIPIVFEILVFIDSPDFRTGVFGFGANQRMFTAGLQIESNITISFFLIIWALICTFSYFKQVINQEELIVWSVYLCMVISSLIFSLILWHPQWLMFATPFMVLTTFINKRSQFFLFLDILMMFVFVGFTVNFWVNHVDQALWGLGIFKDFNPGLTSLDSLMMRSFFIPNDTSIYYSLISACFIIHIVFKFPNGNINNITSNVNEKINLIRIRFVLGIMIFVIPATICLIYPNSGLEQYNIAPNAKASLPTQEVISGLDIGQVFVAKGEDIKKIKVQIGTYARINNSNLQFFVAEFPSGNILYKQEVETSQLVDNAYLELNLSESIGTKRGSKYKFYFTSTNAKPGNAISIWHSSEGSATNETYAVINDQPQNFSLHFSMYGN